MNRKTILAISLLVIAVFAVGSVSALDFGSILGGEENETVTIDGIDFNIPAGFTEDPSHEVVNETVDEGATPFISNGKLFEKDNTVVNILVADYGDFKVTDEVASAVGGDKTTLNNVSGYLSQQGRFYTFHYAKNNKLVVISANNEDIIADFLIG